VLSYGCCSFFLNVGACDYSGTTPTGSKPSLFGQYASRDECYLLATGIFDSDPTRDWRALAPPSMNIECRLGFAFEAVKEDVTMCDKAGLIPYGDILGSCDTRFGCDSYCRLALTACPSSYPSLQRCYDLCSYDFDIPNVIVDSITDGDSSNCRGYHASRALVAGANDDFVTQGAHCTAVGVRASPPVNVSLPSYKCGTDCDVYCRLITNLCVGSSQQYNSIETCLVACQHFSTGTFGDTNGDTLHCRLSHIISVANEQKNMTSIAIECPIAGARPPTQCITKPNSDDGAVWYSSTLALIIMGSVMGIIFVIVGWRVRKYYHQRRIERLLNDEVIGWSHLPPDVEHWK
jgi:hypothetical protein